jgi:hypothetical protein
VNAPLHLDALFAARSSSSSSPQSPCDPVQTRPNRLPDPSLPPQPRAPRAPLHLVTPSFTRCFHASSTIACSPTYSPALHRVAGTLGILHHPHPGAAPTILRHGCDRPPSLCRQWPPCSRWRHGRRCCQSPSLVQNHRPRVSHLIGGFHWHVLRYQEAWAATSQRKVQRRGRCGLRILEECVVVARHDPYDSWRSTSSLLHCTYDMLINIPDM